MNIKMIKPIFCVAAAAALSCNANAGLSDLLKKPQAYQQATGELRVQPAKKYEFNRAVLRDVLRFLADDAALSYIALPEESTASQSLVTFNITASPFTALEMIADAHGIALVFEDRLGVWYMRPVNDRQLMARTYQIRFNTGEVVSSGGGRSFGSSSGSSSGPAGSGGGRSSGNTGQSDSFQAGNYYSPDLSLNNLGASFTTNADELIQNIEKILGITTNGLNANIAAATVAGHGGELSLQTSDIAGQGNQNTQESQPQVIWSSDTNNLWVVASRQQHQYVESYLESVDKPQPLVAIEVKFFETGKDPRRQLGVDWNGVLNGYEVGASGFETPAIDLNEIATTALYPQSAILSASDVSLSLSAIAQDADTRTVSYPRMLTRNNREVVIQSVVNEPVLDASSQTSQGGGGVSTQSVTYLPIGTTVNVLPKIMPDGNINLNLAVTVSSIIGNVVIDGNPYPKASSRVYTAPLKLKSGFTAAIAGLDEADDSVSESGVPFLKNIPLIGRAFKDQFNSRTRKNLMIWITPYILDTDSEGIANTPVSEIPITKRDPLRQAPKLYATGEPVGGVKALHDTVLWADREQRRISRIVEERRIDDLLEADIAQLFKLCDGVINWIEITKPRFPAQGEQLNLHQWSLNQIRRKTQSEKWNAFVKHSFNR